MMLRTLNRRAICSLIAGLASLLADPIANAAEEAARPGVIIVIGAGGAEQYDAMFATWADRWIAAVTKSGYRLDVIGRDKADADNDKQRLRTSLEESGKTPGVDLWIVMIGHGTFDRRDARFNLRGPDVSTRELADWLKPIDRPIALINCASASAPFVTDLKGAKRVLIAATKSGSEQNLARFGDFLSQAIGDPAADLDKDNQTSLWEAFLKASRQTAEFYSTDGRLQTEHAVLDDSGDGQGVRAEQFRGLTPIEKTADGKPLDGQYAHQWHLLRNEIDRNLSPEVLKKRDTLEFAILQLKDRKATLAPDEYLNQLEKLLVELAELNESAEK